MSSATVENDGTIVNTGYSRSNVMANADVSVSREGITRNQIVNIHKKYTDGKSVRYKLYPFSEERYDFVDDILSMSGTDRDFMLDNRYFEVVVDEHCLDNFDSFMRLANQMERLQPVFEEIKHLMVRIDIPHGGCPVIDHEQYTATSEYNCVAQVVDSLNYLKASGQVDIILTSPKDFDTSNDSSLFGYILPFCELDTKFSVKVHEFGDLPKDAYRVGKKEVLEPCLGDLQGDFQGGATG